MNSRISNFATAAAICAVLVAGTAAAAAFPEKPIRIIVPTAIGGPSDLCIRAVTEVMYANLGQPLSVENITGATGNIGLERVANAAPDGYTIVQASAANTANWVARPKVSFDIVNGLKPIGKSALPGFSYNGWNGLLAPKATPDAVVKRLSDALARALADEKVRAIIRTLGNDVGAGTPEDLAAQIRSDLSNFKRIIDERKLVFPE